MRFTTTATLAASVLRGVSAQTGNPVTGNLGNATVVDNNPPGAAYTAVLPDTAFAKSAYPDGGNVKGSVYAVSSPDGTGVMFKVSFSNLPKEGGPFLYHIHDQPVPSDGNCTSTLAHLDPYQRGETPDCDASLPQTCQVGDLSGKHGKVDQDPYTSTYTDDYAALAPGIGAFFGNRSFVFHFANKTRITCANFEQVSGGDASCSASSAGAGSGSSTTNAAGGASTVSTASAVSASQTSTPTTSGGSNGTATSSTSTPSSTFVQAAGYANAPAALLAVCLAVLAYIV